MEIFTLTIDEVQDILSEYKLNTSDDLFDCIFTLIDYSLENCLFSDYEHSIAANTEFRRLVYENLPDGIQIAFLTAMNQIEIVPIEKKGPRKRLEVSENGFAVDSITQEEIKEDAVKIGEYYYSTESAARILDSAIPKNPFTNEVFTHEEIERLGHHIFESSRKAMNPDDEEEETYTVRKGTKSSMKKKIEPEEPKDSPKIKKRGLFGDDSDDEDDDESGAGFIKSKDRKDVKNDLKFPDLDGILNSTSELPSPPSSVYGSILYPGGEQIDISPGIFDFSPNVNQDNSFDQETDSDENDEQQQLYTPVRARADRILYNTPEHVITPLGFDIINDHVDTPQNQTPQNISVYVTPTSDGTLIRVCPGAPNRPENENDMYKTPPRIPRIKKPRFS